MEASVAPQAHNIFLAVVWEKARALETQFTAEIAKHFTLLAETEVYWTYREFTRKLAEFYGWEDAFCWWNKARKVGRGPFKVIVFEDPTPEWRMFTSQHGREVFSNVRVENVKRICRKLSGHSNRFHSAVNAEETEMEAQALFGKNIKAWLAEYVAWKIPSSEQLESLFASGNLKLIGEGGRRACYAIPGTQLCVKCYRDEATCTNATIKREIARCRHNEARNTNCQEFRYYLALSRRLPAEILKIFPEVMERRYVRSKGWCIVENLIQNEDGSNVESLTSVFHAAQPPMREALIQDLCTLGEAFFTHAVRFYDTQNILVQTTSSAPKGHRFRIIDFEPADRTLISFSRIPGFVRHKMVRRLKRYALKQLDVALKGTRKLHV